MNIIDLTKKLKFSGTNGKMVLKNIASLIVHHDAALVDGPYNTEKRIQSFHNYHKTKGWRHIAYHYMIDNVGDVYQCLPETEIGYHAGNWPVNKASIAVCLHGNFDIQQPTEKQKKALADFIEWITTQRPDLPKVVRKTVKGHRDVRRGATACPGKNLYKLIK